MATPEVHVFSSSKELQDSAAQQLSSVISAAIAERGIAYIVLTGGSNGIGILSSLASLQPTIDWSRVHLFFGDERFVSADSKDRNVLQAQEALLSSLPSAQYYPIASSDQGLTIDEAAEQYEQKLVEVGKGSIPAFDVHLFGIGEEGHINSLFPHSAASQEQQRYVVSVEDSPKPPPQRITLTFPAIARARQTWLLVSGENKAQAVYEGVNLADKLDWPAAGAQGSERTVWFVDQAAASKLSI